MGANVVGFPDVGWDVGFKREGLEVGLGVGSPSSAVGMYVGTSVSFMNDDRKSDDSSSFRNKFIVCTAL